MLLLQHRNIFLRDNVEGNVLDRDAVEFWIHCDEIDAARFVHLDIAQVAVGFVADHVRQSGDERADIARDTPAAFAFEAFRNETHRVSRIGESFELQIKIRVAFAIGFVFAEIDSLFLPRFVFINQGVEKSEVAKLRK